MCPTFFKIEKANSPPPYFYMSPFTPFATQVLSVLTVIGQIIIVLAVIFAIFFRKQSNNKILSFVANNGILFAFIVALAATCGSLFYSEIARFTPCELCWFQRIFMYPQVILLGLALIRKDKNIIPYNISLAIIGAPFAIYNYLLQLGFFQSATCSISSSAVSCSTRYTMTFGYITISMMALTAFLLIIVFTLFRRFYSNK